MASQKIQQEKQKAAKVYDFLQSSNLNLSLNQFITHLLDCKKSAKESRSDTHSSSSTGSSSSGGSSSSSGSSSSIEQEIKDCLEQTYSACTRDGGDNLPLWCAASNKGKRIILAALALALLH